MRSTGWSLRASQALTAPDEMAQLAGSAGPHEPVVYDAGVLVAADRNARTVWADHRVRLEAGIIPVVPAPVIAHLSRSASQVQLRRLLRGCDVIP